MRRTTAASVAAAVAALVASVTAGVQATTATATTVVFQEPAAAEPLPPAARAVRQATERFVNPRTALRYGYLPATDCQEMPGTGGVGYRYIKPTHVADGVLDLTRPEALIYVPSRGGLRLGAVGYFVVDADQDLATDEDRPWLFGRAFDGPSPGRDAATPVHYSLNLWAFVPNPNGPLATFNPAVSCAPPT